MENNDNTNLLDLDNKNIGRKIYIYRKIAGLKSFDVAEKLGLKEAAYTKYERGETNITVDFLQRVAQALSITPYQLISSTPNAFFENISNSTILNTSTFHTFQGVNEKQNEAILKLIDNVIEMNKRVMDMMSNNEKTK